jgi:hypothetical protein
LRLETKKIRRSLSTTVHSKLRSGVEFTGITILQSTLAFEQVKYKGLVGVSYTPILQLLAVLDGDGIKMID